MSADQNRTVEGSITFGMPPPDGAQAVPLLLQCLDCGKSANADLCPPCYYKRRDAGDMNGTTKGTDWQEQAQAAGFDAHLLGDSVLATDHCHCETGGLSGHPNHAGQFADPTVETVYTYGRHGSLNVITTLLGTEERATLVKRQDRHEDGSITTTHYLELSESQYKALGGE